MKTRNLNYNLIYIHIRVYISYWDFSLKTCIILKSEENTIKN